ncbi:hypothetical protein [Flavobacterium sp. '19STA2R22 D10 B1']|uniref:hypothetical protein n=1 Tax=Flavobacterium aerium TaxID=3037261 RepID=UPI00278C4002|nr:hypothetical protein [Flavobacterium sp. '19STA2R22 D10 B1']
MNKTLKTFLILAGSVILVAILGTALGMDGFVMLFLMTFMIVISLLIVIGVSIQQSRKKYLDLDNSGKKKFRKRMFIISIITVIILIVGWIILSFQSGYILPQRDQHKDWSYFPKSSNSNVSIRALDSLYIYNLEPIKGTENYLISFAKDSLRFGGGTEEVFYGIINAQGDFKVQYDKAVTVYIDNDRIIFSEIIYGDNPDTTYCDVYDSKTLALKKEIIQSITLPETYDSYSGSYATDAGKELYIKKYRTAFFENLRGIKTFSDKAIYPASDKNRGFAIYSDKNGTLYQIQNSNDVYSLDVLAPQCAGYDLELSAFEATTLSENIKMSSPPIVYKNNLNSGVSIGYGNPNSNGDEVYFRFYQTWLMYYTVTLGKTITSFKIEGGKKKYPYVRFYQLNTLKKDTDALYIVAKSRVWKIQKK